MIAKFGLGIVASSALLGMLDPASILMMSTGVITENRSAGCCRRYRPGLVVGRADRHDHGLGQDRSRNRRPEGDVTVGPMTRLALLIKVLRSSTDRARVAALRGTIHTDEPGIGALGAWC